MTQQRRSAPVSPRKWALCLVLFAALVRCGNLAFQADSPLFLAPVSDEHEHFHLASILAAGDWLGASVGPYHRPQLFPYVCAVLFRIFGTSFAVTHALNLLSDIFAIAAWFAVARRAFPRRAAAAGTAFIALHWTFVHFSATGYMESFAMALNAVFLLAISNYAIMYRRGRSTGRRNAWLIASGVLAGVNILTRPTVLLLVPVIAAFIFVLPILKERRFSLKGFGSALIFCIITAVTISPNAIRHWVMFHMWAPMGTGSELNFHMSNNRDGWGWERSSPGIEFDIYQKIPAVEGNTDFTIPAIRKYWGERNSAYLHEEPGRYAANLAFKFLQVLNAAEVHCTNDFLYTKERSPVLRWLPGLRLFAPLGFAGMALLFVNLAAAIRRRTIFMQINSLQLWTAALLVAWVIVYLIGVAMFLPISRHRLPAIPPLLLLAGFGAMSLFAEMVSKRRNIPRFTMMVIAVIAGALVSNLPVIPKWYEQHERWWTQVNLGVALMSLGRPSDAITELDRGIEIMPEKMETWRQLALAEQQAHDPVAAVEAQKQLLALLRKQYPAYYMIEAQVLEDLIRFELAANMDSDALKTARELMALVPNSDRARAIYEQVVEHAIKKTPITEESTP